MVHGLAQSQAHAVAAKALSEAKAALAAGTPGAEADVAEKKVQLRKALQEYIDPFKVYRHW